MYEIKYHKDYRHNYLIIKSSEQEKKAYQIKMVTQNSIRGLLPCRERYINGDMLMFYEITSRQNLVACYEGRGIGMEVLRKFFLQLRQVHDMLQKYLLEENGLWLNPEYIFCNLEKGEFFFLFYPEAMEDGLSKLLNFFMENVDNEDMKAVETVYKIADMIQGEQFVTDEILTWFQYDCDLAGEETAKATENSRWNPSWESSSSTGEPVTDFDKPGTGWQEELGNDRQEGAVFDIRDLLKKAVVPGTAAVILSAALLYIVYTYELSYQEEIWVMMGWAGVAALLLGTVAVTLRNWFKGKRPGKESAIREEERRSFIQTCEVPMQEKEEEIGNTVFIPWTENRENKLYAMDRRNKHHIDLTRLPLTVGKMAGAVDLVINDQSISRIHARFFRSGNQICVSDLNSTNGTFRNGMRMEPNASEIIEPGDEIRLGRLKFIYR